jgi:hypothetical protein
LVIALRNANAAAKQADAVDTHLQPAVQGDIA